MKKIMALALAFAIFGALGAHAEEEGMGTKLLKGVGAGGVKGALKKGAKKATNKGTDTAIDKISGDEKEGKDDSKEPTATNE